MHIRTDITDAFALMSVVGLASILDDAACGTRVMNGTDSAEVTAEGLSDLEIAGVVRNHAAERAGGSWVTDIGSLEGNARAPLSPRVGTPSNDVSWRDWQSQRQASISGVPDGWRLDRRLIGALGEPGYWAEARDRRLYVDYGASAWEMKTRNRGEEFIQNRLRLLAEAVAARSDAEVRDGLTGLRVRDEVGKGQSSSRTPTGLRAPRASDNALAWCALWGISLFPVRPVMVSRGGQPQRARTAGVAQSRGSAWFGLPLFGSPVSIARVRAVARSSALGETVRSYAEGDVSTGALEALARLGVDEVRVFRQIKSANPNAPEPWLLPGRAALRARV